MNKLLLLLLLLLLLPIVASAQVSTEEKPISFSLNIEIPEIPTILMPRKNVDFLLNNSHKKCILHNYNLDFLIININEVYYAL